MDGSSPSSRGGLEPEAILAADPVSLGRAITLCQQDPDAAEALLGRLPPDTGESFRITVTGPGGVGKSSLLREVVRRLRARGDKVAVVLADPSSVVTAGAVLGDRCRFAGLLEDSNVFLRSLAHRGASGEPAPGALLAAEFLGAAGFRWIFQESVGTGQMDVGVFCGSAFKVLVLSSEVGDDVQMLKAGLLEVADLVVVNKCDQVGAPAWARRLEQSLASAAGIGARQPIPVLAVSATTGEGVDELVTLLVDAAGAAAPS